MKKYKKELRESVLIAKAKSTEIISYASLIQCGTQMKGTEMWKEKSTESVLPVKEKGIKKRKKHGSNLPSTKMPTH